MKKRFLMVLSLLAALALLGGCAYLPVMTGHSTETTAVTSSADGTVTISAEEYARYQKLDELLEIMNYMENDYYKELDEQTLLDGAAYGMTLAAGDPYTFYYTPEDYASMWSDDTGEYEGVGMQITANNTTGVCTISRVFKDSPADKAGVQRGDILYRVGDDMLVTSANLDDAVALIRGEPGTTADVTFLRGEEEIRMEIPRAAIKENWVDSAMLEDSIGYIVVYEFSSGVAAEFTTALEELQKQGIRGLIIDLRDNPGGWVDQADTIADLFLDKGVMTTLSYRSGATYNYYTTDGKTDIPLVILINENSASASEMLTGALQDRAGATAVGVTSYGKGIVQDVVDIGSRGAGMQLTIAEYLTPNGRHIHGVGIEPDVESPLPEGDNGDYGLADPDDPQLNQAIEVMKQKLDGTFVQPEKTDPEEPADAA